MNRDFPDALKADGILFSAISHPSTAAAARGLAPDFREPAVDDIGGAAAAVVGIDVDGRGRAVFGAGPAFHAGVRVDDFGLAFPDSEDAVRADQFAVAAADAFIDREAEDGGVVEVPEVVHDSFLS